MLHGHIDCRGIEPATFWLQHRTSLLRQYWPAKTSVSEEVKKVNSLMTASQISPQPDRWSVFSSVWNGSRQFRKMLINKSHCFLLCSSKQEHRTNPPIKPFLLFPLTALMLPCVVQKSWLLIMFIVLQPFHPPVILNGTRPSSSYYSPPALIDHTNGLRSSGVCEI